MDKLFNGDWKSECLELREVIATLRTHVTELAKERDRLSDLCDKWNTECDEMREDNKRLDAELHKAHQYWMIAEGRCDALQSRIDSLLTTGTAVVERWDSPLWKDLPHTGEFIHALREAIVKAKWQP